MPDDLRPIKLFDSTHDALLARDALAANGIQAVLSSGRVARKGWSPDGHLIQLSVSQNDVHAAEAFFAEADAIAKLHARERCPRCGSPHVTRVTTRRLALRPLRPLLGDRNPLVQLAAPVYRSAAIAAFAASDGETAAPDFGVRSSWISIRRRGIASVACSVSST